MRWINQTNMFSREEKERILPLGRNKKIPINDAGWLSYLCISWITPLILRITKNSDSPLNNDDVWECSDHESTIYNTERVTEAWTKELKDRGPQKASVLRVWFQLMRKPLLILIVNVFCFAVVGLLVTAYIVELIIQYLLSTDKSITYGLLLVVVMGVGQLVRAVLLELHFTIGSQTGIRMRAGFLGLCYQKVLKLKTLQGNDLAEVVTIFGADAERIYTCCFLFVFFISPLVFIIVCGVYLYYLMGLLCFLPLGVYIIFFQIQDFTSDQQLWSFTDEKSKERRSLLFPGTFCQSRLFEGPVLSSSLTFSTDEKIWLSRLMTYLREHGLVFTDQRIRKMAEIIESMKFLKMYAWEDPFSKNLKDIRKKETWYLYLSAVTYSLSTSLTHVSPALAAVITIASLLSIGYRMENSKVFVLISVFNYMRTMVGLLPLAGRAFGEVRVSFNRIKNLLIRDEFVAPTSLCFNSKNAIEIQNGTFSWDESSQLNTGVQVPSTPILENVNLNIAKGTLIGVCGPVGSGKSSLLAAFLGRITKLSGHLAVSGSVAYAAQQACIFNGTIRENITFGNPFDINWYEDVIHACGLEPDLMMFDYGDMTEIGEHGVNLSGGQKQRVSLARAVYSRCDTYLLDDPLSAVDIHVCSQLFNSCIKKVLKSKTVILATHQLQYLSYCDYVLVMENGIIKQQGDHTYLMSRDGYYRDMMRKFRIADIVAPFTEKQGVGNNAIEKSEVFGRTLLMDALSVKRNLNTTNTYLSIPLKTTENAAYIITKEESQVGRVGWRTYSHYISAAGGVKVVILLIICYSLSQGSVAFCTSWIALGFLRLKENVQWGNMSMYANKGNESRLSFNSTEATQDPDTQDTYFSVMIASLGAIVVLGVIKSLVSAKAYISASSSIHNAALDKVMRAPMNFFNSNPSGRILNRFSTDLDEELYVRSTAKVIYGREKKEKPSDVYVPTYMEETIMIFIGITLFTIVAVISLPWSSIAFLPVFAGLIAFKIVFFAPIRELRRFDNVARSPLLNHVNTTGEGLITIVLMKQQEQFYKKCRDLIDVTSSGQLLYECSVLWMCLRLDILGTLLSVIICLAIVCTKGTVDPALSALSLTMAISIQPIMQDVVRTANEVEARFTSIERIQEYGQLLKTEQNTNVLNADGNWPKDGHVLLSDIEMKYRPDLPCVLRKIRMEIKSGEKVGIIGRTGSGKSSLVASLLRLVELSGGHIYIDGLDISLIPLQSLRSKLSVIPQDPVLFEGTIRFNVDPFKTVGDEEIWSSLQQAQMKDTIQTLNGQLNYQVQENGGNFSVGERQLICLARAILRQSKILILDEATASIDIATDALVQQTIRESFSDCTVLTIAHRLNTILHCDKILVMDSGQIVETGSPQDLCANTNSFFNRMVSNQGKEQDSRL